MNRWLLVAALCAGCAAFQPRPIEPVKVEAEFRARGLADPALREFLDAHLPEGGRGRPDGPLDLTRLTLIAFYYHPDLDVARARVGVAEAGILTAGARPNPRISVTPGYNAGALTAVSPWILSFGLDLPIETAGKRGHRIAQAERLTEVARLELAQAAWLVRSRVRRALVEYLFARQELVLLGAEERIRAESVTVMEKRLAIGDVSRPDVDAGRADLASARLAARSAEARVAGSLAALAGSLGVTVAAIDGVPLVWPELDRLPAEDAFPALRLQRAGLLNRADVRRALAEYSAAEALLRLEVARQYPDVNIGPGYSWDQGDNKFSLGLSVTIPLLDRNQGPIAEAEARRRELSARFLAVQSAAIGEIEGALAGYRGLRGEAAEAGSALRTSEDQERATARALEAGDADRLTLVGIQLRRVLAERARLDSLHRAQLALGSVEDALQRALDGSPPGAGEPPVPRARGGQ